ncbi:MAG: ABC transporter ATP-binding protein, partial [Bacteroidetes bacterium]|nr:ABC transporter ATP-binding protein [Bacteroidota bacterium]
HHEMDAIKHAIGVVPQDLAIYPTLTARENLTFFGKMYGLHGHQLKDRIDECLEMFGLEKSAKKLVSAFSGGMKRRLNLVTGLLHKPKILFLDEPTVGIDVQSKKVILEHLVDVRNEGTTLIYTSHYMEEAENLCSNVAIIDMGKVITLGKPRELLSRHPDCHNLEGIFLKLTGRHLRD